LLDEEAGQTRIARIAKVEGSHIFLRSKVAEFELKIAQKVANVDLTNFAKPEIFCYIDFDGNINFQKSPISAFLRTAKKRSQRLLKNRPIGDLSQNMVTLNIAILISLLLPNVSCFYKLLVI
jgi:hypothetical protein